MSCSLCAWIQKKWSAENIFVFAKVLMVLIKIVMEYRRLPETGSWLYNLGLIISIPFTLLLLMVKLKSWNPSVKSIYRENNAVSFNRYTENESFSFKSYL